MKTHAWLFKRGLVDVSTKWAVIPPQGHITFRGHRWSQVFAPFVGLACAAIEARGLQESVQQACEDLKEPDAIADASIAALIPLPVPASAASSTTTPLVGSLTHTVAELKKQRAKGLDFSEFARLRDFWFDFSVLRASGFSAMW